MKYSFQRNCLIYMPSFSILHDAYYIFKHSWVIDITVEYAIF